MSFEGTIVNQQFKLIYERLRKEGKVKSKSDIAAQLGTYNHVINSVLKGDRGLTVDQINKLIECYNINSNFLFAVDEQQMFLNDSGELPTMKLAEKIYEGRNNIVLVPQKASAGYAVNAGNPTYLEDFQRFSVPGLEGQLIAFEINGDSMLPHITNGDVVVCEALEPGDQPKDNMVYVVITDTVVAKRIQRIRDRETGELRQLELISDNTAYPPFRVDLDEVRQILKVKCRLTTHGLA